MMKTRYRGGDTLEEKYKKDPMKIWKDVCNMDRRKCQPPAPVDIFELNRTVTFFKPSIAKHIYDKFDATSVLDPCAGWGGRMLGAITLGIEYQGFETNKNLESCYESMLEAVNEIWCEDEDTYKIDFKSCMDAKFSEYEYDCVLTSPPYYNLETYPHQSELPEEAVWYKTFLMAMISRSFKYMKPGGHCCINMSPKMYDKMMKFNFPKCDFKIDFLQQKNEAVNKKDKKDYIYVWHKPKEFVSANEE